MSGGCKGLAETFCKENILFSLTSGLCRRKDCTVAITDTLRREEDKDEESERKSRLELNKRAGDVDEEGPRGRDCDLDDDNVEKAYEKAISDGVDVLDCPVQMSKDGIPFCLNSIDLIRRSNDCHVRSRIYLAIGRLHLEFASSWHATSVKSSIVVVMS
ncbi:hypothetical protein V8G54_009738 [Vigna mungo]|uniref:glycerophosphodiester phosphodiesterase n=1 Tax=Vigna mungo TaxID=3915 RepID=A0AAQ3S5S1_VIGMU